MNILIYILLLLGLAYLYQIITTFFKISRIENILKQLQGFIDNCENILNENEYVSNYRNDFTYYYENSKSLLEEKSDKDLYINTLSISPQIRELIPDLSMNSLSYNNNLFENFQAAKFIRNELFMVESETRFDLKKRYNPLFILKIILKLPSSILTHIGFDAKTTSKNLINMIFWLITFLTSLFSSEIKSLIFNFIKIIL
ncbi:hypothetical protein CAT7_05039 [Carnobacterium sp. AT7]|uniref:hypothetical protein n=1 Tax=Carnobacterium sp. AT7 TaxID=333990 RepID=UPI00015F197A|nr:hypothetical protein [Carnobacterium sp. AT7]EDP68604.1 hypothetical protein CAT7_05039 [Carnobacterium sp. AT7]